MERKGSGAKPQNTEPGTTGRTVTLGGWKLNGKDVFFKDASKKQLIRIIKEMYSSFTRDYGRVKRDCESLKKQVEEYKKRESRLLSPDGKPFLKN
jgi:hypothetical protein